MAIVLRPGKTPGGVEVRCPSSTPGAAHSHAMAHRPAELRSVATGTMFGRRR